ncbi:MAG: hypothetical protein NTZ12_05905, partial [Candidatus Aminicenantes bacterium]|nr:hypothetical protein [Candidatus Aminicenantes bacterium]
LKDKPNWKIKKVREILRADAEKNARFVEKSIVQILYRPFDVQWIFFHDALIERSRHEVMRNMLESNIGLITNRQVNENFRHSLCSNIIINDCTVSLETRERSYFFPLFLYPDQNKKKLFEGIERVPNIDPKIFDMLKREGFKPSPTGQTNHIRQDRRMIGAAPTPEQFFYYIYTVLYSNVYRKKYAEFLKSDFPRIPFTSDKSLFKEMAKLGEELAVIHLLKSPQLDKPFARFDISGDNVVKKVQYSAVGAKQDSHHGATRGLAKNSTTRGLIPLLDVKTGNVFINNSQYFSNIPLEVWEYQIGGYQVMAKWLKDRKGCALSLDDIRHYIRVAKALQLTIEIQSKIDKLYPQIEKKVIVFYN